MKDIPYNMLKQDGRAYEIMLLRDQYSNTFSDIAKEYEMSITNVVRIYNKLKAKQISLYINHIAISLKYENVLLIRKIYYDAYNCYQELPYVCAYLEKKYKSILSNYRIGEPSMPIQFIKCLPPFKTHLNKQAVMRVITMREVQNASFVSIAKTC